MSRVRIRPKSQAAVVKPAVEPTAEKSVNIFHSKTTIDLPTGNGSGKSTSLSTFITNQTSGLKERKFGSLSEDSAEFEKKLKSASSSITFYRELYALSNDDTEISEFDDENIPPGLISINFVVDSFTDTPDPTPDETLPSIVRYSSDEDSDEIMKAWNKDDNPIVLIVHDPTMDITNSELLELCGLLHKEKIHVVVLLDHRESDKPNVVRCLDSCSDIEDLNFAIKILIDLTKSKKKIIGLGYLLGGCKLGNYLTEKGQRTKLSSAVTIASPWDFKKFRSLVETLIDNDKLSHKDYDPFSMTEMYYSSMSYMHQYDMIKTPLFIVDSNSNETVPDYASFEFLKSSYIYMVILDSTKDKQLNNENIKMWYSELSFKFINAWKTSPITIPYDIDGSTPFDSDAEEEKEEKKKKEQKEKKKKEKKELPDFLKAEKEKRKADNYDFRSTFEFTEEEKIIKEKMDKLEMIVYNTLPDEMEHKYKSIDSYYKFLTYCLLLEELFAQDICLDIYMKKYSDTEFSIFGLTQQLFDCYVQEETHHLKKHPFIQQQPVFLMRKNQADLKWKKIPEFWVGYVTESCICQIDEDGEVVRSKTKKHTDENKEGQITMTKLTLYEWNHTKLPSKYSPMEFAIVPGSIVLGRIFSAMKQIVNPVFINLILGQKKIRSLKVTDENLTSNSLNSSQNKALNSALKNPVSILKGPPGSGKTSTIYEAILRLLDQDAMSPILVVAASNLAVDNIAEKLLKKHKDKILRICSVARERDYPPDHILGDICLHNKVKKDLSGSILDIDKRYQADPKSVTSVEFSSLLDNINLSASGYVNNAQVILSTTATAGSRHIKNLEKIPVIIMDEATQSSEPLTLIALGVRGCAKIVLVGDPAQLSVFTKVKSLQMSLFERILNNGTCSNPLMLKEQYRMHPAISEYPRNVFYGNELKDGITAKDRTLNNIKYPVYFFDHQGNDAPESKIFTSTGEDFGFSWANRAEVAYTEKIVEKLIKKYGVKHQDIGVMTGYSAQREFIVRAFKKNAIINPEHHKIHSNVDQEDLARKKNVTVNDINGLIVASVDAFQGREKKFIVMSCVRSNRDGNIGFMQDKRRMNVAFTRAQYSFILIGNAACLSHNEFWADYIKSLDKKGYVKKSLSNY